MKTLILNLVANIFSTPANDHSKDYEKIEKEYITAPFNKDVDIYILLLFTKKDNTTDIKVRKLVSGVTAFIFEDAPPIEPFDFGDIENLNKLFTKLNNHKNYTNKILVTWDHGYGYLMFKNELVASDLKFLEIQGLISLSSEFKTLLNSFNADQPVEKGLFDKYKKDNKEFSAITDDIELSAAIKKFNKFKTEFKNIILTTTLSGPQLLPGHSQNPFDGLSFSTKELTALTINELAEGIEKSELKKFNLIVMSNCYMQNIDTAYALKDCTDYLISPQTIFPWESYDFSSIVPSKGQAIDDDFCKTILEKTHQSLKLSLVKFNSDVAFEEIGFSCIKTNQSDTFFNELKKITTFLSDHYDALSDEIYFSANEITDLSHIQGTKPTGVKLDQIDLYFFLEFLNTRLSKYAGFSDPFNKLKTIFDKKLFVLENKKGNLLYWNENTPIPKNACKGVSIFFPKSKAGYENSDYGSTFIDDDAPIQTRFSKDFSWGLFIDNFLGNFNNIN